MGKKLPITPNTQIKNAIRRVWLYSRERREAIVKQENICEQCDKKGSTAKGKECKIEVHHLKPINWEKIFKVIRKEILVAVKYLEVLCVECHKEETKAQRERRASEKNHE